LKKVNDFIKEGRMEPAVNQLFAFMCRVEANLAEGKIDQGTGDDYLFRATEILEDLGTDPDSRVCN